jgi:zinc D-Ala-D-Ala dipeptidase
MRASICLVLLLACVGTPAPKAASPPPVRVEPVRPIEELRKEALAASPPIEEGKRPSELVELRTIDASIPLDLRYASTNNFLGTKVYEQERAFLQRPAAEAVVRVHRALAAQGFGVLIHDAYRPWYVTKIFWDATPADKHDFVADPAKGSRHNRGCAVDLTLYDRKTGHAVEMPSAYDEFSERARADYPGGTPEQRRLRAILRTAMEAEGFVPYEVEWWHFDYKDWKSYAVENVPFEAIGK